MGDKTAIEWTRGKDGTPGATWNPIRGTKGSWFCEKISPGCKFCYAARMNQRFGGPDYVVGADTGRLDRRVLTMPLRWKRPRNIFVGSMTDLFLWPKEWIDEVLGVCIMADWHTHIILTKRSQQMRNYFADPETAQRIAWLLDPEDGSGADKVFPIKNAAFGISAENQEYFDFRIKDLMNVPAWKRFVSAEPLLGPIRMPASIPYAFSTLELRIDGVLVGGESDGPEDRRLVRQTAAGSWTPTDEALQWVRDMRDEAETLGRAFHFKQWGGPTPKSGGRILDGRTWNETPW